MSMYEVYKYIDANADRYIDEFRRFLQQPSISTTNVGVRECADLLKNIMVGCGVDALMVSSKRPEKSDPSKPVVFGVRQSKTSSKTLLCYGHYDVKPAEPLDQWVSPPFSSEIRDGKIYARGACDDKQLLVSVHAVDAFLKAIGEVPVTMKFIFEGEEEHGSTHLGFWVEEYQDLIAADAMYGLDGGVDRSTGLPVVSAGRGGGILYVELRTKCANIDVHPGEAYAVPNAAEKLSRALMTLKDENDQILIEGWYNDLVPLSEEEKNYVGSIQIDEEALKSQLGLKSLKAKRSGKELTLARYLPSCEISGIHSGYTGFGEHTLIPHEAFAKIDFRLKLGQDSDKCYELLKNHLQKHGFGDIDITVYSSHFSPDVTSANSRIVQSMAKAAEKTFGVKPIVNRPIPSRPNPPIEQINLSRYTRDAIQRLGIPSASSGIGDRNPRIHAPNEFMSIEDYIRGIKYAATIMKEFGLGS
jgi:acetylornithine deacetylase/succinyl-diaminopimelate desuccinylase-like protein